MEFVILRNPNRSVAHLNIRCEMGQPCRLLLIFDGSGMILTTKWLEEGRFTWPPIQAGAMRLTPTQFAMLFDGLSEWRRIEQRPVKRPTIVA